MSDSEKVQLVSTKLSPAKKKAFRYLAKQQGLDESKLLRALIDNVLPADLELEASTSKPVNATMFITWEPTENDRLLRLAFREHTTRQGIVRRIVRSVLERSPQLNDESINVLRRSNYELNAIGRNINQMTRALHDSPVAAERLTAERLSALSRFIAAHTTNVADVINGSWRRYTGLDDDVFKEDE